jgi:hypothetical protein
VSPGFKKPVPDTVTLIPTGADVGLSVIVWAFTFGRSEVAVEMSNTSTIRILLVVLRVEPWPGIETCHDLLWRFI